MAGKNWPCGSELIERPQSLAGTHARAMLINSWLGVKVMKRKTQGSPISFYSVSPVSSSLPMIPYLLVFLHFLEFQTRDQSFNTWVLKRHSNVDL